MTPEYKAEKEAFVSFLSGGGIWEINAVTLAAPVGPITLLHVISADMFLSRPLHFYGLFYKGDKASSRRTAYPLWLPTSSFTAARFCSQLPSTLERPRFS